MTERAVVLAGGLGPRLAPHTGILPKPLVPLFQDKSIIGQILSVLANAIIPRVTIILGLLGHLLEAVVGEGKRFGLRIETTREVRPLGTAGRLWHLKNVDRLDRMLFVNGDTFTDLGYRGVLHRLEDPVEAVVASVERTIDTNYGLVPIDDPGRLAQYQEKPSMAIVVGTDIHALGGSRLDFVKPKETMDMPDLLTELLESDRAVHCFISKCKWKDLSRTEDFADLHYQPNSGV